MLEKKRNKCLLTGYLKLFNKNYKFIQLYDLLTFFCKRINCIITLLNSSGFILDYTFKEEYIWIFISDPLLAEMVMD